MEVNTDTPKATRGGKNTHVLTPDTGNAVYKKSMGVNYSIKRITRKQQCYQQDYRSFYND